MKKHHEARGRAAVAVLVVISLGLCGCGGAGAAAEDAAGDVPGDAGVAVTTGDTQAGSSRTAAPAAAPVEDAAKTEASPAEPPAVRMGPAAGARGGVEPSAASAVAGPAISFENRIHDFGKIWDIEKQMCVFQFTNTGDERLVISEVKPSCGCTATQLDRKIYEPGETSAIEVAFSPKGFGRQSKYIDVISNAHRQSAVRLTITAEIDPFIKLEPHTLSFGEVALRTEHSLRFVVSSPDPNLRIKGIRATARPGGVTVPPGQDDLGYITARQVDQSTPESSASHQVEIEVTLHDTAPWGRMYGTVSLSCEGRLEPGGAAILKTVSVPVNATIFGDLRADELMFRVAIVRPGDTFERSIRLTRSSGDPFTVLGAEVVRSSMPGIRVQATPIADLTGPDGVSGYEIVLTGDSGSHGGTISGHVRVTTDVAGEESLDFQFAGNVRDVTK